MALAAFPNRGHLLMDQDAEYAQNTDRTAYLLSTPLDTDSLSDRQCYVRSHFVELFIATSVDVSTRHSRGAQKLHLNQIGLRCAYCVKLKGRDRAERAICYPSSISRIYQTVADMQRFHFESCVAIPPKVLHAYKSLKTTRPRGVGSPQSYWDKSAREIGLVDTVDGIQVCGMVGDSEGGEGSNNRLVGQKKSVVTGMLERLDSPQDQQASRNVHDQMLLHNNVKEEEVPLGTSIHTPQANTTAMPSTPSAQMAAVVSSPGSDNASKEEDEHHNNHHNHHHHHQEYHVNSPGAGGEAALTAIPETPKESVTECCEAEDANILLMLKKTPESPPRNNDQLGSSSIAVKEEEVVSSGAAEDVTVAV